MNADASEWLSALRFRLSRSVGGEFRFTQVRFANATLPARRVTYLVKLMTGSTVEDVLRAMSSVDPLHGSRELDQSVAGELRAYFTAMVDWLPKSTPTIPLPVELPPAVALDFTAKSVCQTCPRHLLANRHRAHDAAGTPDYCECARERTRRKSALASAGAVRKQPSLRKAV